MRNFIHFRKKWQNLSSYLCFIFLFYIPIYFPIPGKIQGTSFRDFKRKFLPRKLLLLKVQYENKGILMAYCDLLFSHNSNKMWPFMSKRENVLEEK